MQIYIVTCAYNASQYLIDCAFKNAADAEAYAKELNGELTDIRCFDGIQRGLNITDIGICQAGLGFKIKAEGEDIIPHLARPLPANVFFKGLFAQMENFLRIQQDSQGVGCGNVFMVQALDDDFFLLPNGL